MIAAPVALTVAGDAGEGWLATPVPGFNNDGRK